MFLKVMHVLTVICLVGTARIVNARQRRGHQIQSSMNNNNNNLNNNGNISYNKCISDKVCVHGLCSKRTHRCVCYQGWSGDVCDKLTKGTVFSPRVFSNQMRSKVSRKVKVSEVEKGRTLTPADRYVAELLKVFFPRLREYFRRLIAVNIPRLPAKKLSPSLKLKNVRPVAKQADRSYGTTMRSVRDVKTSIPVDTLNGNNLYKGVDVRTVVERNQPSGSMRNMKAASRNSINKVTQTGTSVISDNTLPGRVGLNRNTAYHASVGSSGVYTDNTEANNDLPADVHLPSAPISVVDVHATNEAVGVSDEGNEESDDVCKDNYKIRSASERVCTPGLVCKYGKCSREHKGSYIAFECSCDQGAVGLMCDTKCCLTCGGNGRCDSYYDGSAYCRCRRGYYGSQCEHSESEMRYANPHISPLISIRNALSNVLN